MLRLNTLRSLRWLKQCERNKGVLRKLPTEFSEQISREKKDEKLPKPVLGTISDVLIKVFKSP